MLPVRDTAAVNRWLHRHQPEPGPVSHAPHVEPVSTVTCANTGPETLPGTLEGRIYCPYTLADVEAWCARLRELGAGDGLCLTHARGLWVVLDVRLP